MKGFKIDGALLRIGTIVFDLLILDILWVVISALSLGILAGNATVAMENAIYHGIILNEGNTLPIFFSNLKRRFIFVLLFSVAFIFISAFAIFDLFLLNQMGGHMKMLQPVFIAVLLLLLLVSPYVTALLSQTQLKARATIRMAFLLTFRHVGISILCLIAALLVGVGIYATYGMGALFLISPLNTLTAYLVLKHVLTLYDLQDPEPDFNQSQGGDNNVHHDGSR